MSSSSASDHETDPLTVYRDSSIPPGQSLNADPDRLKSVTDEYYAEFNRKIESGETIRSSDYWDAQWWYGGDPLIGGGTLVTLVLLVLATVAWQPVLFTDAKNYWPFWMSEVAKFMVMVVIGGLGGLVVLKYGVKVNYTRKIQHFFAYLVPLLVGMFYKTPAPTIASKVIVDCWGYWWVLLSFSVLIYPIRTRIRIVDVIFFSLDRPEDRPRTLDWIISQVVIGYIILEVFKWYTYWDPFNNMDEAADLLLIPVLITGIGDGLAEPVGKRWGRHKYKARGLCSSKKYTRSYEGSATVLVSGWISCAAFYNYFGNWQHFVITIIVLPPLMTLAEAFSPHTWDTPFLMLTGVGFIWGVTMIPFH